MNFLTLLRSGMARAMWASRRLQPVNLTPSTALHKGPHVVASSTIRQQPQFRASSSDTYAADVHVDQLDMLVQRRLELMRRSPHQLIRIRGVTFDNRQELVQQLVPGQPLMFVKEPGNPMDPTAVQVQTLAGAHLGYVSRYLTAAIPLQVSFGSVYSVGQTASGTWGALVSCCPVLHGLSLELLPQSWQQQTDFGKVLGQDEWQQLQLHSVHTHHQQCAITGAQINQDNIQLQVIPRWLFDHHQQQVLLYDFIPVAEQLAQLHENLGNISSAEGDAAAVAAVQQDAAEVVSRLMHWRVEEGNKYVGFAVQRQRLLEQQQWKLVGVTEEHCQRFLGG